MKKILITGGAGFIGSNLALKLLNRGYKVTILDNLTHQIHGSNPTITSHSYKSILNKVNFIKGSVTSRKDWVNAIIGQEVIVHLAAETGTGQSMYNIEKYVQTNINGTSLMLDFLINQKHSIRKIIVASSRAIYGEGKYECITHGIVYPKQRNDNDLRKGDFNCKCPNCNKDLLLVQTDENSKILPSSIYGITKYNQEQMCLLIGNTLKIPTFALRFQNVYGPGQSLSNPYTGILSIFSTLIKTGKSINIFEDGKESRDFVYIDDVVDSILLSIESELFGGTFNVGTGKRVDVLEVAKILVKKYQIDTDIQITGNYRIGDIRHNYADISSIQKYLNYTPKFDFNSGIQNFVNWVNVQNNLCDSFEQSIRELRNRKMFR